MRLHIICQYLFNDKREAYVDVLIVMSNSTGISFKVKLTYYPNDIYSKSPVISRVYKQLKVRIFPKIA